MGMMEQEAAGNLVVPEWAHQIQAPAGWTCQWLKCTGCDRDEAAVTHLTSHVQTMVTESTECKLNTCLGLHREADRKHLELHLENCTFGNGASTRCTWEGTCTRRFADLDKYREHLETHMLLDRTRFQCLWKDCMSSGFATAQELLRHILHFHISGAAQPVVPAISCRWQDCQFKLEVSEAETATNEMAKLQEHVMSAHADWDPQLPERVLVCRWGNCRRFFNDKTKFSHHTCMHTGMKKFKCSKCDQTFTSESQRRAHLRRHQRYFKCEICASQVCIALAAGRHSGCNLLQGIDKAYTSGFNLKEHMRNIHQKQELVCQYCQRSYKSHKAWSIHTRQVSVYKCTASVDLIRALLSAN